MLNLSFCSSVKTSETVSGSSEKIPMSSSTSLDDPEEIHDDCDFVIEDDTTPSSQSSSPGSSSRQKEASPPMKIVWRNVIKFAYLHLASLYGVYLTFTSAMGQTNVFAIFLYLISMIGVTAGAHRLWSHRSYKARLPLRILLAFFYTIAVENDIYDWARDHRVHHKYSETDADPHNAKRGFFFAHIGWLLCRKHPEVIRKGKAIDTSDLLADPVVMFHRRYYIPLVVVCCFVLPTTIPMYLWDETFSNAFFVPTILRYCFTLNQTWLVNSAAHLWGHRPYDATISPRQNALTVLGALGEGFHNYHHTFPYDYASSEFGFKYNLTTAFIDAMALFGLAYDRKIAPKRIIASRKLRTGEDSLMGNTKAFQSNLVQNATEAVQNGVMEASKTIINGVKDDLHLSKVVQGDVLQLSKVVQDDARDVLQLSKVVQDGVNDILMTYVEDREDTVNVLQTSDVVQKGIHKRMTHHNAVQTAVHQTDANQLDLLQNGMKDE